MRWSSRAQALAALLAALSTACRRAQQAPSGAPPRAVAAPRGRWTGDAPGGPALRVEAGRYLAGSARRTDTALAAPPYPARPLVAAARVASGWRFATADGAVLEARDFLGPLTEVGRFEGSARPLSDGLEDRRLHAFSHRGALAWRDAEGRAWSHDGRGARRLPLEGVLDALFVSAQRVFAITAPGALHRSDDGGARFAAVPLDDGEVALALGLAGDDALLATSRRRLRLDPATGAFVEAPGLPSPVDLALAEDPPPVAAPVGRTLPDDPARAAALADGTLAVAVDDALRLVDLAGGEAARTVALPGRSCALAAGHGAARAVCTHEGWARAVYALRDGSRWELLRDELRAEPMGAVAFDDRSEAWVVAAPCRQQPQADATALCAYLPDGRPRTVHAPFAAQVVDFHDGAALVTATDGAPALTRAVLLRGEAMTALSLPVGPVEARAMRWHGDALSVWSHDARGALVLHRAEVRGDRVSPWQRVEAPAGALRGLVSRDMVIAWGRDASALWSLARDGRFTPLPSPVQGDARALALDLDAPSWCAGRVCRIAGALEFASDATGAPWFIARAEGAAAPPPPWRAPGAGDGRVFYGCSVGPAEGAGPELDHGAAVSGYALHWERAGASLVARWEGATVRGALRAPWPAGVDGAALTAAAPVSATAPIALFSWCAGATCARRLGTPRGLFEVSLAAPERAHRSDLVMAEGGRVMALARGVTAGRTVAYAALLDPVSGGTLAARAVACDGPPSRVLPGSLGGVDGLWIPVDARRWRFVPLRGEVPETVVEDPGVARACPATATLRGVLRRIDGYSALHGEGWSPIADEWQIEERLELDGDGLCARSVGGGESRDESAFAGHGPERDLVRSFALASDGDGHLTGSAWRGRQRFAMRCERVERAPPAAHAERSVGLQFP